MRLAGKRIAYLVEEGFEDLEFWVPVMRLREEGAQVIIIGTGKSSYHGKNCLEANPDKSACEATPDDYDALVVPGGWAPDKLRRYPAVLSLVRGVYLQERKLWLLFATPAGC